MPNPIEGLRRLRCRFRAWRTARILAGLSERQRKDIGHPTVHHWRDHDPRPVMRYPFCGEAPADGRSTQYCDEAPPRLRRAG
ncbi:hypothetical protein ABIE65_004332 [Constrictibacter sp. MBR-5]|jgi:hypothetical protein|uniref:hypothetical protein n=1 Tax=Constrictibacter sp. MBR-5 TaxID=3156467 RepID=UPI00339B43DB